MRSALLPFVERWLPAGRSETADKHAFLMELCRALEVPAPGRAGDGVSSDRAVLDRVVHDIPGPDEAGSASRIDLSKERCFVLQIRQGPGGAPEMRHNAMERARTEAIGLARRVQPRPPFVVLCDIGRSFELHASFDGSSRYRPFPDAQTNRWPFNELPRHADTLRTLWTAPYSLDPSKQVERVTEEAGSVVASFGEALRSIGHPPDAVADFLLACLFAMFAEDLGILSGGAFSRPLEAHWISDPEAFPAGFDQFWWAVADAFGGRPGGQPRGLRLREEHLRELLRVSSYDWSRVDPCLFGQKLASALEPTSGRPLDAPLAPRAHLERLVSPTIEAPLRADWDAARAEACLFLERRDIRAARSAVQDFRRRLAQVQVLDPACDSGALLSVAQSLLQGLDDEAVADLRSLGEAEALHPLVSPTQLRGMEANPRRAEVAQLMLWLGHHQWRSRTREVGRRASGLPPWQARQVEVRDALLEWDARELLLDGSGRPVTLRRRESGRRSPETTPADESAEPVFLEQYVRPRKTEWPRADFIIGSPPFTGWRKMPASLGPGYVTALRAAHSEVPPGADLAAYWWERAAALAREGAIRRFGFILPSSFSPAFESALQGHREKATEPLRIVLAFRNHPLDRQGRILTTIVVAQHARDAFPSRVRLGVLDGATGEASYRSVRHIDAGLSAPLGLDAARPLAANVGLCSRGVWLDGAGFVLNGHELEHDDHAINPVTQLPLVRPYMTGRHLMGKREDRYVIDFFGLDAAQAAGLSPRLFERVAQQVKPAREGRRDRAALRARWWGFGNDARAWRRASAGLARFIATSQIAKHRVFAFLDGAALPDTTLSCIALDDAYFLGVLSSRVHLTWVDAVSGGLFGASRYDKAACFDPFPFPNPTELGKRLVREIAEALDAHRRARQASHPVLTLTGMYNVLSKLRGGLALDDADRHLQRTGEVSVLRQLHDELDRAVLEAYGWPQDAARHEILERAVALNRQRAREEQSGLVRSPRLRRQSADQTDPHTVELSPAEEERRGAPPSEPALDGSVPWPGSLNEQIIAVRDLVAAAPTPCSTAELAAAFRGAKKKVIARILGALAAVGAVTSCTGEAEEPRWTLVEGGWP